MFKYTYMAKYLVNNTYCPAIRKQISWKDPLTFVKMNSNFVIKIHK
jgi:hypothetical protein